jgi:hypothetical protein
MPHTVRKILTKDTILLQTSFRLEICRSSYGLSKLRESQFQEFWDSTLGVLGQNDIWVLAPWPCTKNTTRGKVVASPKFESWWVLWVHVCPCFVRASKVPNYALTNLLLGLCRLMWIIDLLVTFLSPHPKAPTCPSTPQNVVSQRTCSNSFSFHYFHLWIRSWIHQGVWGCFNLPIRKGKKKFLYYVYI